MTTLRSTRWPGASPTGTTDGRRRKAAPYRCLGRGIIDFPALLAILKDAGYDGWIVDDMDYSAYAALECATVCRTYLRDALGLAGRKTEGVQR